MTDYQRQKYFGALSLGLEDLWLKNSFTDIDVQVDGKTFSCHRVVLGAVSHYFATLFNPGFKESTQREVQIQGISKDIFETVLKFVYTGYDPVTKENVDRLLKTSVMLQIKTLQDICEAFLHKHLGIENCIGIKRLATMHGLKKLGATSWAFIIEHFPEIFKGEEFPNLDVAELLEIITDQHLYTPSEEYVCDAVLFWLKHNADRRKGHLKHIFEKLFFVKMSVEYLENLRDGPLLTDQQDCKILIDGALDLIHESVQAGNQATLGCQRMEEIICMVGTRSRDPNPQKTEVECYSSRHNIKFKLAPLPSEPGPCFAVCNHGNDIYISGGYIQQNMLLHFAAESDQWYQYEMSTNGRWSHMMVSVGEGIYLIGGMSKTNETVGTIDRYDPVTKKCEKVADLAKPVSSMTTAVLDKKVYIFGGKLADRTPTTTIQCFDTVTNTTRIIGDLPISCAGSIGRSVMSDQRIFLIFREGIIVEFQNNSEIKTVCQIDFFDHFGAVQHQGKVLIIGSQSSRFKTFSFDPETKQANLVETSFKAPMCNFYCLKLTVSKDYLTSNITSGTDN